MRVGGRGGCVSVEGLVDIRALRLLGEGEWDWLCSSIIEVWKSCFLVL